MTVESSLSGIVITGSDEVDSIRNSGENVTIRTFGGEDKITNTGANALIEAGDDSDYIYNTGANSTIYGGGGNERVVSYGANSTIFTGDGDDSVMSYIASVTTSAGNGNDTINVFGRGCSVDAGAGNDTIKNSAGGAGNILIGGAGDDTFDNKAANVIFPYANGDGNDLIKGFKDNSTLQISGATHETAISGDDIIVAVGNYSITLEAAASLEAVNIISESPSVGESINNTTSNVSINGTAYDDTISNSGTYVTINALNGDDSIYSSNDSYNGAYVTINASAGNDTVVGRFGNSSVYGGAGADKISMTGDVDYATIVGGAGDDTVWFDNHDGRNIFQYAQGDGYDSILNFMAGDTISIGGSTQYYLSTVEGDVVVNIVSGGAMTVVGAASFESVNIIGGIYSNSNDSVSINGTAYDDTISNSGTYVTINALNGDDSIYSSNNSYSGAYVTIDADAGDDTIVGRFGDSSLNGGAGADKISMTGDVDYATIVGGAGDDTVWFDNHDGRNIFQYAQGDGYDSILNFMAGDTISISGTAQYTTLTVGDDAVVSLSGGAMTVVGAASWDTINIVTYNPYSGESITNSTSNVSVNGTAYDDTIANTGTYVTINAVGGDDSITNSGYYASIYAGDEADTVYNSGDNSYIDLGAGDDSIYSYDEDYSTISGGEGNDTVSGNYWSTSIDGGADNDNISLLGGGSGNTVKGGTGDDTIYNSITSGVVYQYAQGDGYDSILNFMAGDTISIGGSTQYYLSTVEGDVVVNIVNGGAMSLVGAASLESVNIIGGTRLNIIDNSTSNVSVNGTSSNDTIINSGTYVTINALGGNDSIYSSNDSYSGAYVTIDAGAGSDTIVGRFGDSSINGGAGADKISMTGDVDRATIVGGTGNDTVWFDNADGGNIFQYAFGDGYDSILNFMAGDTISISGTAQYTTLTVGDDAVVSLSGGAMTVVGAASLANSGSLNIVPVNSLLVVGTDDAESIGNTLDGATIQALGGDDTITNSGNNVSVSGGEGADLFICGGNNNTIADYAAGDIISVGASITASSVIGSDATFTIGSSMLTVKDGRDKEIAFIQADGTERTIIGGAYIMPPGKSKVTLTAQWRKVADATALTNAVNITGNAQNNSIFGGTGNDTLNGVGGNDYLVGGAGDDVFIYTAGKDVIADYAAGDRISVNADITASSVIGSDATFTIGSGMLTVKDGRDKEIAFIEADGTERTIIGGAYIMPPGKSKVTLTAQWRKVADATKHTDNVNITGNDQPNSIFGGAGNDTLNGVGGNDYLVGGAGDDVFIYTAGKDVIADYAEGDRISVNAAITASSVIGSDATFTIGSGMLTVKDGRDKEIEFIQADGTERTIIGGAYISNDNNPAKVTLTATWRKAADATKRTKAINLTGNAQNNSIFGGAGNDTLYGRDGGDYIVGNAGNDKLYGESGNDTLWGGIGNDTLTGGAGADVFLYENGEGKDVITGFDNNDMLLITGTFSASYNASTNAIAFKVGSTADAVTLQDFTATKFYVNGFRYQIKNNSFVRK